MSMFTLGEPIRNYLSDGQADGNITVDLSPGANVPTLIVNEMVDGRWRRVALPMDREAVVALMAQLGQALDHM